MGKLFSDKPKYFEIQYLNSRDSIIPFLTDFFVPNKGNNILEIGSSEGGVLKYFTELGCICTGIELAQYKTVAKVSINRLYLIIPFFCSITF
jgi:hypothetical protein